jgi:hypothetical protein
MVNPWTGVVDGGEWEMMTGRQAKGRGTATPAERAAAVAAISSLLEELAEAERGGDDELWNEISDDGVEVVLGDTASRTCRRPGDWKS